MSAMASENPELTAIFLEKTDEQLFFTAVNITLALLKALKSTSMILPS